MAEKRTELRMSHPIVVTFLIFAVIGFMYAAAEFLRPIVLSVLLAFALSPITTFLERRRIPRVAAVVLTVVLVLGTLGGVSMVVWNQLNALTSNIDEYRANIQRHMAEVVRPDDETTLEKLNELGEQVIRPLDSTEEEAAEAAPAGTATTSSEPAAPIQKVEIVARPTFQDRLQMAVGPYLEFAALGFLVLILVIFMLLDRANLSDRIIQLFGHRQISITTRTMDEAGQRISRFLGTLATYNALVGLIIGLGLWAIGVEYAVLWGFLGGALRFIPYVGPTSAFVMPLLFSIASSEGWREPMLVIALFGVLELISNGILEPILYGKTTGVSAVGLLVAAMFWTWLWGPLGLLLSTPMTVCLAVLGKYVPSLRAFGTLLGEEAELEGDVRYYQRILAFDQDGATEIIEEALKARPRVEVYDSILIPALARAERDHAGENIDDREQAFLWRVTNDILDSIVDLPEFELKTLESDASDRERPRILGVAANDTSDAIVLRMLQQIMARQGFEIEILAAPDTALTLSEKIVTKDPQIVVLSHLPPVGLTPARYLVRRLASRLPDLPIVVGRWGEGGRTEVAEERLKKSGAASVVFTLADARDRLIAMSEGPTRPTDRLPGQAATATA